MNRFLRALGLLCVLCGALFCEALDREAFTITRYDLNASLDPAHQGFSVRGTLTVRNDTAEPQRLVDLQVTSTLTWKTITSQGKKVQWLAQPYVSDIDHTGSLSEAIVTLPAPVPPKGTAQLEVFYEGTIPADTTRLERLGVPADAAARSEWDRISPGFTAVRGLGYVVWYPVGIEAADLSRGNEVFDAIAAWKQRHAASTLSALFWADSKLAVAADGGHVLASIVFPPHKPANLLANYVWRSLGQFAPTFAVGGYAESPQAGVLFWILPGHEAAAADYARVAGAGRELAQEWFGKPVHDPTVIDLPDASAEPYESGTTFFTPLKPTDSHSLELTFAHQWTHAALDSPRLWIYEGAATFAQALQRERQRNRQAALDYMASHLPDLVQTEAQLAAPAESSSQPAGAGEPLVVAADQVFYRTKAMYVFWMLRELIGDQALQKAFQAYRAADDKEPSYFQRLVEAQSHKDLEWFFDDWVYRDRGLPDLRIAAIYPRPTLTGSYTLTVTLENLGGAAAEVPVTVRGQGGEVVKRVQIAGHAKEVLHIDFPGRPLEVTVNDGSVPEPDMKNNSMTVTIPKPE